LIINPYIRIVRVVFPLFLIIMIGLTISYFSQREGLAPTLHNPPLSLTRCSMRARSAAISRSRLLTAL